MSSLTTRSNANAEEYTPAGRPEIHSHDARDVAHRLMNELTAIDLWVFQIRYAALPLSAEAFVALERAVEKAMKSAKALSQQIKQTNGHHDQDVRQPRTDSDDQSTKPHRTKEPSSR